MQEHEWTNDFAHGFREQTCSRVVIMKVFDLITKRFIQSVG